jgi:hypothetical protein
MGGLEVVKVGLMDTDGLLELLDVLSPALSEGGLSLPVPLLALLGRSIDLETSVDEGLNMTDEGRHRGERDLETRSE